MGIKASNTLGREADETSVQFRCSVVSDSLRPLGLQHTRPETGPVEKLSSTKLAPGAKMVGGCWFNGQRGSYMSEARSWNDTPPCAARGE